MSKEKNTYQKRSTGLARRVREVLRLAKGEWVRLEVLAYECRDLVPPELARRRGANSYGKSRCDPEVYEAMTPAEKELVFHHGLLRVVGKALEPYVKKGIVEVRGTRSDTEYHLPKGRQFPKKVPKLSDSEVREIRKGGCTHAVASARYGVCASYIWQIRKGKAYKGVS
jgi:hypothetical protein